tara:strand:+ start:935 stop:1216 length:282 start_codon:yes stop_codon:yes gene_type:complete
METILTVLITLGVMSLLGTVWGVVRLNKRVDDLEVARMDIDDELIILRKELEEDIEHLYREMSRDKDYHNRNLDSRLDKLWTEVHKLFDKKNK